MDGWPSLAAVGNIVKGVVLWGRVGCWSCRGRCRVAGREKENAKQNVQGGGLQAVNLYRDSERGPSCRRQAAAWLLFLEPPRMKSLSCPWCLPVSKLQPNDSNFLYRNVSCKWICIYIRNNMFDKNHIHHFKMFPKYCSRVTIWYKWYVWWWWLFLKEKNSYFKNLMFLVWKLVSI